MATPAADPPVRAGVYQAVDKEQLGIARKQYALLLEDNAARGKKWTEHRKEYAKLKEKLSTLSDEATRSAMIPMGKKAFCLGKIVHTNEITVLLGDNWFAERSTKQAAEICQRRLDQCDEMLNKLCEERRLSEGWLREAEQLGGDSLRGEGNLEIREPYDEAVEEKWRKEHRERVKAEKKKEKAPKEEKKETDSEEELWRRLDELELQEELDAHLENEDGESESEDNDGEEEESAVSSDLSQSPPLTDDEEEDESSPSSPPSGGALLKRRVSFGATTTSEDAPAGNEGNNEPLCIVEFRHSDCKNPPRREGSDVPADPLAPSVNRDWLRSPSDLEELVSDKKGDDSKKGILKPFAEADLRVWPDAESTKKVQEPAAPRKPFVDPIGAVVTERDVGAAAGDAVVAEPPKRVSKFKQSRMASKK